MPDGIPTCCAEHRAPVIDFLDWQDAVDASRIIASAMQHGWTPGQLDEAAAAYERYRAERLHQAVEFGREMWLLAEGSICWTCGAAVSHGKCWGCGA